MDVPAIIWSQCPTTGLRDAVGVLSPCGTAITSRDVAWRTHCASERNLDTLIACEESIVTLMVEFCSSPKRDPELVFEESTRAASNEGVQALG